jgi:hypothetical protein
VTPVVRDLRHVTDSQSACTAVAANFHYGLRSKSKMKDFGGETPYSIMFGPDICGFGTRKTHFIVNYKEKNHLVKKDIKCETDQLSHVYTLRLMPNNTYEVRGTVGLVAQSLCNTQRGLVHGKGLG